MSAPRGDLHRGGARRRVVLAMANRAVHWYEGMFLNPQHFQADRRHARDQLRESEDWFHPFDWGLRSVDLDRDAIANYLLIVRSCQARFKDGTRLSIPDEGAVDPLELKGALSGSGTTTVYLAVPSLHPGRSQVEPAPRADGPRYWIDTVEVDDENTGAGEQSIQVRRVRARLLVSGQDQTGYEVLPLARVARSARPNAPPEVDAWYVPPLLAIAAWPELWREVQSACFQIAAKVDHLAGLLVGHGISFSSQVPGESERLLKLAVLNGAVSYLRAAAPVAGLTPLGVYLELCRLVGQLAIFSDGRKPPALPAYDHEDLGGCFATVLEQVRLGLATVDAPGFEERPFERIDERLQVGLEPAWLDGSRSLFVGVTTDLGNQECDRLLRSMDMKIGSGRQVERFFKQGMSGLGLVPLSRPPRALPARGGIVYYEVEHDPNYWRDVAETGVMAIRMNLTHATFRSDRILSVAVAPGGRTTNLQFAIFVI